MTTEISDLIKSINAEVQIMESKESCIYKLAIEVVTYLERRFQDVKSLISEYKFVYEKEEILFFNETKPQLFNKLIYYSKVSNIEDLRPTGSLHAQKRYFLYENDQLPRGLRKVELNLTNVDLEKLIATVPKYEINSMTVAQAGLV
jgi:hypothetical protein